MTQGRVFAMVTQPTVSRKQRLLRSALLSVSLVAFAYAYVNTPPDTPDATFWRGIGFACALGSVFALVWFVRVLRSPDDQLRCWQPDPTSDPATRSLRLSAFGGLALVGVAAFAGALGGYGFSGAVWWRSLLVCIGWPTSLTGVIGLVLVLREGRAA